MATMWGAEFLVNTTTRRDQGDPAVAALSDGRFVMAWTDSSRTGGDKSNDAVRARIFNADGSKAGGEFLVNTTTQGYQRFPVLAALNDGSFVIAWSHGGGEPGIRAQLFGRDGLARGGEFMVSPAGDSVSSTAIAALSNGGFVVAWEEYYEFDEMYDVDILGRSFDADGKALGNSFGLAWGLDYQEVPAIAGLPGGRFAVAYRDEIEWPGEIAFDIYGADGSADGDRVVVNYDDQFDVPMPPAVAARPDGSFIVVWLDIGETPGGERNESLRAQTFTADGTISGDEMILADSDGDIGLFEVAVLADGRFVAVWSVAGDGKSGTDVRARVFDGNGTPSAPEFTVNTTAEGFQGYPEIAALADGRFVVAWDDNSQSGGDAKGWAVRAQIFDPRTDAVDVKLGKRGDQFVGTQWADRIDGAAGADRLSGESGADILVGGRGADILVGGAGADRLEGGKGRDTASYENATKKVVASLSDPKANRGEAKGDSYASIENLTGSGFNDRIVGDKGANQLLGGPGDDRLEGGGGPDILIGGLGSDVLTGGGGADVFMFRSPGGTTTGKKGRDVITDFTRKQGDRIDLSYIDAKSGNGKNDAFAFIGKAQFSGKKGELRTEKKKAATFVYGDVNGDRKADFAIEIAGALDLKAKDFVL